MNQPIPARLHKAYISSAAWDVRRWERFIIDEFKCQGCGSEEWPLDCHHLTYKRLGQESIDDLVSLCRSCHRVVSDNQWNIDQLQQYLENPKPSRDPLAEFILGMMLIHPIGLAERFNEWLEEINEPILQLYEFEIMLQETLRDVIYLFDMAVAGCGLVDKVQEEFNYLTNKIVDEKLIKHVMTDDLLQNTLRRDLYRLRRNFVILIIQKCSKKETKLLEDCIQRRQNLDRAIDDWDMTKWIGRLPR